MAINSSASSLKPTRRRQIIALVIAALVISASKGLLSAYSYWGDEMFSVVGSMSTWQTLIPVWVMQGDVHPPLYHIILKGWMALFGNGEIATRSLSFLCGTISILLLAWYTRKRTFLFQLLAISVLGTSPAFAYYMQETRSYAMVLLLSTAVTISALNERDKSIRGQPEKRWERPLYYLLCVLLSLTHYFGWIFVFSLTLINLFEALIEPRRWKSLLLLAVISIWPTIHILYGSLGDKTGGNFWINSSVPILSTVNHMLMGVFPLVLVSKEPYRLFLLGLVLIFFIRYAVPLMTPSRVNHAGHDRITWFPLTETAFLTSLIALLTVIMTVIDINTPMSTARNYIVLLPCVSFLLAGIIDTSVENAAVPEKRFLIAIATWLLISQLYASQIGLREKSSRDNWKSLAEAVKRTNLCENGCYSDRADTYFTYYFQPNDLIRFPDIDFNDAAKMKQFVQQASKQQRSFLVLIENLRKKNGPLRQSLDPTYVCLQPKQSTPAALLLVPGSRAEELKQHGLLPCQEDSSSSDPQPSPPSSR